MDRERWRPANPITQPATNENNIIWQIPILLAFYKVAFSSEPNVEYSNVWNVILLREINFSNNLIKRTKSTLQIGFNFNAVEKLFNVSEIFLVGLFTDGIVGKNIGFDNYIILAP